MAVVPALFVLRRTISSSLGKQNVTSPVIPVLMLMRCAHGVMHYADISTQQK